MRSYWPRSGSGSRRSPPGRAAGGGSPGRPWGPTRGLPGRGDAVLIERLGDAGEPLAFDGEREDPPDDRGLLLVDAAEHVRARAAGAGDLDVVVAVDAAPGDVAGGRLPRQAGSAAGPSPAPAPGRSWRGRASPCPWRCRASARGPRGRRRRGRGLNDLFQRVGRLDLLATEARLLQHDEHLKTPWVSAHRQRRHAERLQDGAPGKRLNLSRGEGATGPARRSSADAQT